MTTKRTDDNTDPTPDTGQALGRKTILASGRGVVTHTQRPGAEGVRSHSGGNDQGPLRRTRISHGAEPRTCLTLARLAPTSL